MDTSPERSAARERLNSLPAFQRPGKLWSEGEREQVLRHVQEEFNRVLLSRAQRFGHAHSAPEELVDTFTASDEFLSAMNAYDPARGLFSDFIVKVFHFHCIQYLRWLCKFPRTAGKDVLVFVPASDKNLSALSAEATTPEELAVNADAQRKVRVALGRLRSARQRNLLVAWANGESLERIRARFGYKTVNAVKTKLAQARHRLRAEASRIGLVPRPTKTFEELDLRADVASMTEDSVNECQPESG